MGVPKSKAKDGRLGREWQYHRPPRLYPPWTILLLRAVRLGEGSPSPHEASSHRVEAFGVAFLQPEGPGHIVRAHTQG